MSIKLYLNKQNLEIIYNSLVNNPDVLKINNFLNNEYNSIIFDVTPQQKTYLKIRYLRDIAYSEKESIENSSDDKIHNTISGIVVNDFFKKLDNALTTIINIESCYEKKELIPRTKDNILQLGEILIEFAEFRDSPVSTKLNNGKTFFYINESLLELCLTSLCDTFTELSKEILNEYEKNEKNYLKLIILFIMFQIDYLSVHPFRDCNGRTSRILTSVLFEHIFGKNNLLYPIICNENLPNFSQEKLGSKSLDLVLEKNF